MTPVTPVTRWQAEAIWEAVAPTLPGFTVEVLPEIDSTNTELMRRARAGQHEPTLLVAERQTAGRGRMGRVWDGGSVGGAGELPSLMFSLGLPLAPRDWSGLSLAVGVCVAESLDPAVRLKWPNDLWLADDRKLGGILVETASFAPAQPPAGADAVAPRYVVVGIGINITPRMLGDGGGLSNRPAALQELVPGIEAPAALARVAAALVATVQAFEHGGFVPFQARFHARDVLQGRAVRLSDGTDGVAQGVNTHGALQVATAQGIQTITSSEISVRPAAPSAHRGI